MQASIHQRAVMKVNRFIYSGGTFVFQFILILIFFRDLSFSSIETFRTLKHFYHSSHKVAEMKYVQRGKKNLSIIDE